MDVYYLIVVRFFRKIMEFILIDNLFEILFYGPDRFGRYYIKLYLDYNVFYI